MIDDGQNDGAPTGDHAEAAERERIEADVVGLVVTRGAAATRALGPVWSALEAELRRRRDASSISPPDATERPRPTDVATPVEDDLHATRRISSDDRPSSSRPAASRPSEPQPAPERGTAPQPSTSHRGRSTAGRRGDPRTALVLRATRLGGLAPPRIAKRLSGISEQAGQASRDELDELAARLAEIEVELDRSERAKAVRAVRRAERVAARRRGSPALDDAREDLRAAILGGKLPEIVAYRERLDAELGPPALWERRGLLAAAGVLILTLVVIVAVLAIGGDDLGSVRVFLSAPATATVEVEVRQGDEVLRQERIEVGGEEVEFELAPGFYEILIDGRSLGRPVHVFRPGAEIDVPVTGTP